MIKEIVLITGKAGVGKDSYVDKLINDPVMGNAKKYAFADHIKSCARLAFNWNGTKDERGRQLLIDLGKHFRNYDPLLLIRKVAQDIKADADNIETAYITDCRFNNEVIYFKLLANEMFNKDIKVTCIKLSRNFKSTLTADQQKDETEQGIDIAHIDAVRYL